MFLLHYLDSVTVKDVTITKSCKCFKMLVIMYTLYNISVVYIEKYSWVTNDFKKMLRPIVNSSKTKAHLYRVTFWELHW